MYLKGRNDKLRFNEKGRWGERYYKYYYEYKS